jgi:hypothetical protein
MPAEHAPAAKLGRLPTLAEVADYATFVASDRAGAMTGAMRQPQRRLSHRLRRRAARARRRRGQPDPLALSAPSVTAGSDISTAVSDAFRSLRLAKRNGAARIWKQAPTTNEFE